MHLLVSNNPLANRIIAEATAAPRVRSIGLSDITLNRSQQWHVDLLRGPYRKHLTADLCWGAEAAESSRSCSILQPGASLRVLAGAHAKPVPLDDDRKVEPQDEAEAQSVPVKAGSLVIMDIRLPHRGSSEEELATPASLDTPKILVSTVLAGSNRPLGAAMERGNFERMLDWDDLHRDGSEPEIGRLRLTDPVLLSNILITDSGAEGAANLPRIVQQNIASFKAYHADHRLSLVRRSTSWSS